MPTVTSTSTKSSRHRRNSFPTATLPSLKNPAPLPAPWTTAKCHRLLRPLCSKLQALRAILQTNPSVSSVVSEQEKALKRKTQLVRRQRGYEYDGEFIGSEARGIVIGGVRRKFNRTYSGAASASSRSQSRTSVPVTESAAASIGQGAPGNNVATSAYDVTSPAAAPQYHPMVVLNSLKPSVHPSVYPIYLGIYASLETLLLSTNLESTSSAPKLQTLATRKIAHCILATMQEIENDDVWYDSVSELGRGGEHLRELVRWHGIELIREAIKEGLFNTNFNGIGMAGVLVGLCRSSNAEIEAESLLQTMLNLQPVGATSNHPPLQAIVGFYGNAQRRAWRILASSLELTSRRSVGRSLMWLGNVEIIKMLKEALEEVDESKEAAEFVGKALQLAFGVWGEGYMDALKEKRKKSKKKDRRISKAKQGKDTTSKEKLEKMTTKKVGEKAEGIVCRMVKKLIKEALLYSRPKAKKILETLVEGLLAQSEDELFKIEGMWSDWWPENAKLAVLIQGLEKFDSDPEKLVDLLSDTIEAALESEGVKEGMKYLASFIAECYCDLYDENGRKRTQFDEIKTLVSRLLSLSEPVSSSPKAAFSTPRKLSPGEIALSFPIKKKVVTFTPGKPALHMMDSEEQRQQVRRWYVSQIALHIAIEFSTLDVFKSNEKWIVWVGRIEHQVVGLKIGTPGSVKRILEEDDEAEGENKENDTKPKSKPKKEDRKEKKGWRWEEGIDAWVAVGGTPGAGLKKKRTRLFLENIQIQPSQRTRNWRREYKVVAHPSSTPEQPAKNANVESPNSSQSESEKSEEPPSPQAPILPSSPIPPHSTARIRKSLSNFVIIPPSSSPVFINRRWPPPPTRRNIQAIDFSPPRERTLPSSAPNTIQTVRTSRNVDWLGNKNMSMDIDGEDEEVRGGRVDASSPVRAKKRSHGEFSVEVNTPSYRGSGAEGIKRSFRSPTPQTDIPPSSPPPIGSGSGSDEKGEDEFEELNEDLEDELSFHIPDPILKVKKRKYISNRGAASGSTSAAGDVSGVGQTPRRDFGVDGVGLTPREMRKIEKSARRRKVGKRRRRWTLDVEDGDGADELGV
ncbi:hypothetical protein RUND412_008146 [Rhizina undulata]